MPGSRTRGKPCCRSTVLSILLATACPAGADRQLWSSQGSGPCPARDCPLSPCKPLAGKLVFLPWPPAHTHPLYLQREGLSWLFLHAVDKRPQQSFALAFLIQSLGDKCTGEQVRLKLTMSKCSCQIWARDLHHTPAPLAQSGTEGDPCGCVSSSGPWRCWAKTC